MRSFELGTLNIKPRQFTANKIILSRVVNLPNSALAELVDKSRKEIVKPVIKIIVV